MGEDKRSLKDLRQELLDKVRLGCIKKLHAGHRDRNPRPFPEACNTKEMADLLGVGASGLRDIAKKLGVNPVGGKKMKSGHTTWWDPEDFRRAYLKALGEEEPQEGPPEVQEGPIGAVEIEEAYGKLRELLEQRLRWGILDGPRHRIAVAEAMRKVQDIEDRVAQRELERLRRQRE